MKKINILKEPLFETKKNSVRTARRFYSVFIPEQDYMYLFKNKKTMTAFITDFQKEVDIFISIINQITADLYFIYRQNWIIYKGKNIADHFLTIDKILNRLTDNEKEVFDIVNDIIKLINDIYFIIQALKKSAQFNKNYSLSRYVGAFEFRIDKLTDYLFSFGKSGKWAAYGEKYNPKKLY